MEVTDPLEKKHSDDRGSGQCRQLVYNDLAIIQVEIKSTVPDEDIEQCWDMLRRKVSDAGQTLPAGTSVPSTG